jgi:hypothetical protein
MKSRYDAKVKPAFRLAVGDRVWYFYPRRYSKLSPKWQNLYVGPYTVTRLIDPCNVAIRRNARTREIVVHRDKLRPAASLNRQADLSKLREKSERAKHADEIGRPAVSINQRVHESGGRARIVDRSTELATRQVEQTKPEETIGRKSACVTPNVRAC